ncbi:MAG: type II toxin-antitoxin system RelE/ParE family toxin [Petrimonas sp.]|nr:type II toxin-antitoxin system RelE/ParE family toxin [Petrimonas sp.]
MEVVWSKTAKNSLATTIRFIKGNFGEGVAKTIRLEIEKRVGQLVVYPLLGKEDEKHSTSGRKIRYIIVNRRSRVYYYLQNQRIYIILVWDTRQDIHSLKKLLS